MSIIYESPFSERYASEEMQYIFSSDYKFKSWRRLWIALAKAERELGLPITAEQIEELERFKDELNLDVAAERERIVRHDVMAHVFAYGVQCPGAAGIIHLGATSMYVCDNTDILTMRDALLIVRGRLISVISLLSGFAKKYRALPCLAYTHLQPAQLTTVGKRAVLWISELMTDLEELDFRLSTLKLLGNKGTTGTQASFLELFEGDGRKVERLEKLIAENLGMEVVPVSGQTYSRKLDYLVLSALSGIAQTASKFSCDMRILQSFKEMEEPFEKNQIGSSAMPYKRNPMRSERITALARFVIADALNPAYTAATQWFERTLDDSANRRLSVAEAFLAVDSILIIMQNVCDGLLVYENMISSRVMQELPFMATENIMMSAVKKGGDRQELHERLREHSQAAAGEVKNGRTNDLVSRIASDPSFGLSADEINALLKPEAFTGRAPMQVDEYLNKYVQPVLDRFGGLPTGGTDLRV